MSTLKLADIEVKDASYLCTSPCISPCMSSSSICSSFGQVVQYVGDGDAFQSDVSLSEVVVDQLRNPHTCLQTQRISEHSLELACAGNRLTLSYPYPVQYDDVMVQLSRKQKTLRVQSSRAINSFWSRPLFLLQAQKTTYVFNPYAASI